MPIQVSFSKLLHHRYCGLRSKVALAGPKGVGKPSRTMTTTIRAHDSIWPLYSRGQKHEEFLIFVKHHHTCCFQESVPKQPVNAPFCSFLLPSLETWPDHLCTVSATCADPPWISPAMLNITLFLKILPSFHFFFFSLLLTTMEQLKFHFVQHVWNTSATITSQVFEAKRQNNSSRVEAFHSTAFWLHYHSIWHETLNKQRAETRLKLSKNHIPFRLRVLSVEHACVSLASIFCS